MKFLWRAYSWALKNHPYPTASVTTSILMGTGDIVAQKIIEEKRGWDGARTARFAFIGAAFFGPTCTYWYRLLDRTVLRMRFPTKFNGLVQTVRGVFMPVMLFSLDRLQEDFESTSTCTKGMPLRSLSAGSGSSRFRSLRPVRISQPRLHFARGYDGRSRSRSQNQLPRHFDD